MKTKARRFLFAMSGALLLGCGVLTAVSQTQSENESELVLSNIEALAKPEDDSGFSTVEDYTVVAEDGSYIQLCRCYGYGILSCC